MCAIHLYILCLIELFSFDYWFKLVFLRSNQYGAQCFLAEMKNSMICKIDVVFPKRKCSKYPNANLNVQTRRHSAS